VTPDDIHLATDWRYFQPKHTSLTMMSPERFVKNILRAKCDTPLLEPAYAYQFGHDTDFATIPLAPKLVGDMLIESELSLRGQFKLIHELKLSLDPFRTGMLNLRRHEADAAMQGLMASIDIDDFDVNQGVSLSLCCNSKFSSTSFSVQPGEPLRFEAEFESKEATIGYWLDWKVAANLSMVLRGKVKTIKKQSDVSNELNGLAHDLKEATEYVAFAALAAAGAFAIFTLAPVVLLGAGIGIGVMSVAGVAEGQINNRR